MQFPGDKGGIVDEPSSQPDQDEPKRGQNLPRRLTTADNHRANSVRLADGHGMMDTKFIDLNMKPQRTHEQGHNNQVRFSPLPISYFTKL